ncbi:hypothetical protein RchiOBHm_Chr2g0126831 [Rosa chinensis]|uniref:Uncharacterized protein n=1 Tax=Rosa chinensis TaxID=74649 RepID=A0A2P6RTW3_ROSCH|nr:hypothetical protein RchiOBHm_Chr2g0126821 [Rosa chinensis]PRQ49877.1 hypothetical protein RchiOBHm_Chr2g0126831 [Rosa chinensis]
MMEDMIFTAPSSSSSPCLKTQNFATRECVGKWKGNGETKKMEWVKELEFVLRVRGEVYL